MMFEKVVRRLKQASEEDDDDTMIACLLMATKSIDLRTLTDDEKTRLLRSIGYTFLHRLLDSHAKGCHPDDDSGLILGISILSSFLDTDRLSTHPFLHYHTTTFNSILLCSTCRKNCPTVFETACDCLYVLALRSPITPVMNGTLSTLIQAALTGGACVKLKSIYSLLCDHVARNKLDKEVDAELGNAIRGRVVGQIKSSKDAGQLADMLDNLRQLLQASDRVWRNAAWLEPLYVELGNIAKMRIESSRRLLESVLLLVSTLAASGFGLRSMLSADSDSLVILFLRICVEIKMLIEDPEKQGVLCQYFLFVELFIMFLVDENDGDVGLKATQQYACLDNLADCIRLLCKFLQKQLTDPDGQEENKLFNEALIRLCCCFAAEESTVVVADFQPLVSLILSKVEEQYLSDAVIDFLEPAIRSMVDAFTVEEMRKIQEFLRERNRALDF